MRTLGVIATAFLLACCALTGSERDASVDFMFRLTGAIAPDVVDLAEPALVNELNGAFTIEAAGLRTRAMLGQDGAIQPGENRVFLLDFIDHGDIAILRSDDKRLSLRAELGPGGRVVRGLLGWPSGRGHNGFLAFENDRFEGGTWQILYDGPDIVVGRLELQFHKYAVSGNFRAPRLR